MKFTEFERDLARVIKSRMFNLFSLISCVWISDDLKFVVIMYSMIALVLSVKRLAKICSVSSKTRSWYAAMITLLINEVSLFILDWTTRKVLDYHVDEISREMMTMRFIKLQQWIFEFSWWIWSLWTDLVSRNRMLSAKRVHHDCLLM